MTDDIGLALRLGGAQLDADDSLAQLVLHEICHLLVQGPAHRDQNDWGLDNTGASPFDEVRERVASGRSNAFDAQTSRTTTQIVRNNVFTVFNGLLLALFLVILATGRWQNGLFGAVIVANSAIGIIQELRAKQTLDKLAIVGQAKPMVRRQSGTAALAPSEVVLDDAGDLEERAGLWTALVVLACGVQESRRPAERHRPLRVPRE